MKIRKMIVVGLFLAGSSSVLAGSPGTIYGVSEFKVKANIWSLNSDGRLKKQKGNSRDLGEMLNGGNNLNKDEIVAALIPCSTSPIMSMSSFYITLFNLNTGVIPSGAGMIQVSTIDQSGIETKKDKNRFETMSAISSNQYPNFMAYSPISYKTGPVKGKGKTSALDNMYCVNSLEANPFIGSEDDAIFHDGRGTAGKPISSSTAALGLLW